MIVGIGTDIVLISRMSSSLDKLGVRFAERLLTSAELCEFSDKHNPAAFLAKRFAAKEALVKAMGTGFSEGITWRQITVCNDKKGAPFFELCDAAKMYVEHLGIDTIHLSLADEREYAVAFVILEKSLS